MVLVFALFGFHYLHIQLWIQEEWVASISRIQLLLERNILTRRSYAYSFEIRHRCIWSDVELWKDEIVKEILAWKLMISWRILCLSLQWHDMCHGEGKKPKVCGVQCFLKIPELVIRRWKLEDLIIICCEFAFSCLRWSENRFLVCSKRIRFQL